jgi:hypothetical protein
MDLGSLRTSNLKFDNVFSEGNVEKGMFCVESYGSNVQSLLQSRRK